ALARLRSCAVAGGVGRCLARSGGMSELIHEQDAPAPAPAMAARAPAMGPWPTLGENLRRLRRRKGFSLDRLARASGVSRAMLGQIELAQSAPTLPLLSRVATGLAVPFGALLRALLESDADQGSEEDPAAGGVGTLTPPGPWATGSVTAMFKLYYSPNGCSIA